MRFITVTLIATDTPANIKTLAGLTAKFKNIALVHIYPESGNNQDATNGSARIGGSDVDRVAAGGVKGFPLLPGIVHKMDAAGSTGAYSFETLFITGQSGDVFQVGYITL